MDSIPLGRGCGQLPGSVQALCWPGEFRILWKALDKVARLWDSGLLDEHETRDFIARFV